MIKKRKKSLRMENEGGDLLGEKSRSVQSWKNVPRFHMDKIMGKSDKVKK